MILFAYLSENTTPWYNNYATTAQSLNIIKSMGGIESNISRHDAALMLFRAYKNQDFSLQEVNSYTSFVLDDRADYIQ